MNQFAVFIRGINVGGNKKVPMAELKAELEKVGFEKVHTLLNSGNIVFSSQCSEEQAKSCFMEVIENQFGFFASVIVLNAEVIKTIVKQNPFKSVPEKKEIKTYVSLLGSKPEMEEFEFPWSSDNNEFTMIRIYENILFSVCDISQMKSVNAMKIIEETFGKDVTTRTWNTIIRVHKKLD